MDAPFPWFGGKHSLADRIVALLPPHNCYVEPFGGAASVLLAKPPSPVEVYSDVDGDLVNFFRVLRERKEELLEKIRLTPYARAEHRSAFRAIDDAVYARKLDPVERARLFYVIATQSFTGRWQSGWSYDVSASKSGAAALADSDLLNLLRVADRLRRVQIEDRPWYDVIRRYDSPDTVFYLDPPYPPSTRPNSVDAYRFDMTDGDHAYLARVLLSIRGAAVLSGYATPLYRPLEEAGWRREEVPTHTSTMNNRATAGAYDTSRTECLWVSPPPDKRKPPPADLKEVIQRHSPFRPLPGLGGS